MYTHIHTRTFEMYFTVSCFGNRSSLIFRPRLCNPDLNGLLVIINVPIHESIHNRNRYTNNRNSVIVSTN